MKFAVLALFSLALPTLARPAAPQPLLPAPMSRRTINLWEKWTGENACDVLETVTGCKDNNEDCGTDCVCAPWTGCGLSASFWCPKKGGYLNDDCDCILPSSAPDSGDSHARRSLICPTGQSSCLINPGFSKQTECLDLRTTLDSCGGCTSQGEGLDCTQIPNVEDVNCEYGACKIYACERGFKLENGTACVLDSEYKGIKNLLAGASVGSGKVWTF